MSAFSVAIEVVYQMIVAIAISPTSVSNQINVWDSQSRSRVTIRPAFCETDDSTPAGRYLR
jgi:hypothetical protein